MAKYLAFRFCLAPTCGVECSLYPMLRLKCLLSVINRLQRGQQQPSRRAWKPSKLKAHALVLAGLLFSASAIATEHKSYIQLNVGAAFAPSFSDSTQSIFFNGNEVSSFTYNYKEDYDAGYAASVAAGYHLAGAFRLEGELMYQSNKMDKFHESANFFGFHQNLTGDLNGERESSVFLLNSYYDLKNSTAFTPYITGGIGGYHLRLKGGRQGSSENILDFAWQVGTGFNYKLDENISFDLRYRYLGGADAEIQLQNQLSQLHEVGDHQVMGGIRVGF